MSRLRLFMANRHTYKQDLVREVWQTLTNANRRDSGDRGNNLCR